MGKTAPVHRITFGLLAKPFDELDQIAGRTGLSKTDIINRSITLYAFIDGRLAAGDELLIRSSSTGEIERIRLV